LLLYMNMMPAFTSPRTGVLALTFALLPAATVSGASLNGVPNFQTVNDHVYRGAQPSTEGFQNLAKIGIKTVVDLREEADDRKREMKAVSDLGMRYVHIPMKGMRTPSEKQISDALKVLNDDSQGPVFVHCRLGKDRTGVVIAAYRIQHDGWENQRALKEARSIGMSWFQFPLQRYLIAYKPPPREPGGGLTEAAGLANEK
jgi:tyrosine-protein phosphatase SIW14